MIKIFEGGAWLVNNSNLLPEKELNTSEMTESISKQIGKEGTITFSILESHNHSRGMNNLELTFDSLASHDLTFVGVIQTAKASGLTSFPLPYVLTNCHNSLCAVGGTLNEDDHLFGLSAAKKYGGIFVPPHEAVIHSYVREKEAGCGAMILGSDSHTRYGALGTMGIGEGGGELVKQLLEKTYDMPYPEVVCVYLTGETKPGVGPQDVSLALISAVFSNNYAKNKVLEFIGPGVNNLSIDFRNGIDVMTTETTCLSSIWETDDEVKKYYEIHGRENGYKKLQPKEMAYYDGAITINLSEIEPMIALPFHPSNAFTIAEFQANAADILRDTEKKVKELLPYPNLKFNLQEKLINGKLKVDQAIVAGCSGGTYENIREVHRILGKHALGNDEFSLSVYPASQPVTIELSKQNVLTDLMKSGAIIRTAFCGPCFGAGDVPFNNGLSIRHTTRNFPNREGSKPGQGQLSSVALMDARSIAATALNNGILTPATNVIDTKASYEYAFDNDVYSHRVYNGFGNPKPELPLAYGPNIVDWPTIPELSEHMLLGVASVINDPVTTTDELIPSGDTSTYRSNPVGMAEFTLSRKDPNYVKMTKVFQTEEKHLAEGKPSEQIRSIISTIKTIESFADIAVSDIGIGSLLYAMKPGDGSAREQAASCQRVLGGTANIAKEYATKRYRSNLVNWGMLPLITSQTPQFDVGDYIFLPNIKSHIQSGKESLSCFIIKEDSAIPLTLQLGELSSSERNILVQGCLINYYKSETL